MFHLLRSQWSVQFSSVTQLCLTLWDPTDWSMPGFLVHHKLWELAQTHVHRVGDTIQSSYPLLSLSPSAFNLSQHQGIFPMSHIFTLGDQSIVDSATASELPMRFQDWFPLGLSGLISLLSKELSRVFSNTTVQKHQLFMLTFFMVQHSHPYMNTGKTIDLTRWTFVGKVRTGKSEFTFKSQRRAMSKNVQTTTQLH